MARQALRRNIIPFALITLIGCGDAPAPSPQQVATYSIEQFLGNESLRGGISFSADGSRILVTSDRSGIYNAWEVPTTGGEPAPLTASDRESIIAQDYFPEDDRFLFTADQGGNELTHIFVREPDGRITDLTPGDNLKATYLGFAPDGRSLFLLTNERDSRYFDLYEVAAEGYERTLLFRNEEGFQPAAVSPDKHLVALEKTNTRSDSDIFLHDRATGQTRLLTPHEGEASHRPLEFTRDGSGLLYLTNAGSEFVYLARQDLSSGERRVLVQPEWDVQEAKISHCGRFLVVEINRDARTEVRLYEAATLEPVELPELPEAQIRAVSLSRDSALLAFLASPSRAPWDLWVHDRRSGETRRLTRTLNPEIDSEDLVDGQVMRFASFDGVEIPGILYLPHGATPENRVPALINVHGGPGGQSRVGYDGLVQYLVNHGYAVFEINNRGSSGYGKSFFQMDDHAHGQGDLDDCVAAKGMLAETGMVDPERIGIMGGSYGGYMVLAALAFRPQEFTVGVDIFGVANWVRTLKSIPPWWEEMRLALYREIGDPGSEEEYLRSISPLFHAGNIVRPLLVLQGANDPRVLQVESDEMVEAARRNGAMVEYIVFDDEGHGFRKKKNRHRGYRAVLQFLDTHLKAPPTSASKGIGHPS